VKVFLPLFADTLDALLHVTQVFHRSRGHALHAFDRGRGQAFDFFAKLIDDEFDAASALKGASSSWINFFFLFNVSLRHFGHLSQ